MNGNMTPKPPYKKTPHPAKECAYIAVFVALLIALQLALTAVPGVEAVTVLFVSYAYVFGWKRGMAAATAFSLLRQMVFGFYPVVLILYLLYYNGMAALFGTMGKRTASLLQSVAVVTITCLRRCFTVFQEKRQKRTFWLLCRLCSRKFCVRD